MVWSPVLLAGLYRAGQDAAGRHDNLAPRIPAFDPRCFYNIRQPVIRHLYFTRLWPGGSMME
jgi:hypothetical protein